MNTPDQQWEAIQKRYREGQKPTRLEESDLPVPRMQMTISFLDDSQEEKLYTYGIVTRHFLGHLEFRTFSYTRAKGCSPRADRPLDTPLRDGAHIKHEAAQLGIPAYIICGDRVEQIDCQMATVKFS